MKLVLSISIISISLFFVSCRTISHEIYLSNNVQKKKLTLPADYRKATLGDEMLSEGDYKRVPSQELLTKIESSIPGGAGLPFTFIIEPCLLKPTWRSSNYTYYEAPAGKFTANHGMLGTVVKGEDKIGIRVHRQNNGVEWYVDNSNWNSVKSRTIIWAREVRKSDGVKFKSREDESMVLPDSTSQFREVTYGGFANGNYTLTFREVNQNREYEKDFLVPRQPIGPTPVSIKGCLLEITEHSSVDVTFRVLRSFTR